MCQNPTRKVQILPIGGKQRLSRMDFMLNRTLKALDCPEFYTGFRIRNYDVETFYVL
jgi:hypothetical protein